MVNKKIQIGVVIVIPIVYIGLFFLTKYTERLTPISKRIEATKNR